MSGRIERRMAEVDHALGFGVQPTWMDDGCAMCGHDGPLVNDHCHLTGIWRGPLCRSCNVLEGTNGDSRNTAWWWWRRTAPGFTLHDRTIMEWTEFALAIPRTMLHTASGFELVERAEAYRFASTMRSSRVAALAMERALGGAA